MVELIHGATRSDRLRATLLDVGAGSVAKSMPPRSLVFTEPLPRTPTGTLPKSRRAMPIGPKRRKRDPA